MVLLHSLRCACVAFRAMVVLDVPHRSATSLLRPRSCSSPSLSVRPFLFTAFSNSPHQVQASGLLYISELIEEHSRLAKLIGQRGTYVCTHSPLWPARFTPVLLDCHHSPSVALYHRFSPPAPDDILNHLPHGVFAELFVTLASHLPVVLFFHCFVHHGHPQSFSVVPPFLSSCARCQTALQ